MIPWYHRITQPSWLSSSSTTFPAAKRSDPTSSLRPNRSCIYHCNSRILLPTIRTAHTFQSLPLATAHPPIRQPRPCRSILLLPCHPVAVTTVSFLKPHQRRTPRSVASRRRCRRPASMLPLLLFVCRAGTPTVRCGAPPLLPPPPPWLCPPRSLPAPPYPLPLPRWPRQPPHRMTTRAWRRYLR